MSKSNEQASQQATVIDSPGEVVAEVTVEGDVGQDGHQEEPTYPSKVIYVTRRPRRKSKGVKFYSRYPF